MLGSVLGVALFKAIALSALATGSMMGIGLWVMACALLASLSGEGHEEQRQALDGVFGHLFLVNAGFGALALLIALSLPDHALRGRGND